MVLAYLSKAEAPRVIRLKLHDELREVFAALDASLRDREAHTLAGLRVGEGELARRAAAARLKRALEALRKRMAEVMPDLLTSSSAEASNLIAFARELPRLARILERTPEELPPGATYAPPKRNEQMRLAASLGLPQDRQMVRHSLKTGLAVAVAFVVSLMAHHPQLAVMIQTVLLVGPPTFGAQVRKMGLRLAGGVAGALLVIPTIMILSPNFDGIGAYLIANFIVLLIAAYIATSTTRINYAGLQGGISFVIAVATLAPSLDVTEPLWRIWGTILGLLITTIVFLLVQPEYSGRALAERMPPFLRAVILMISYGSEQPVAEERMRSLQMYTVRAYQEILSIAEDARLEGYRSGIDHTALIDVAENLARIGYRLGDVAMDRAAWTNEIPAPISEARDAFEATLRRGLQACLDSFERPGAGTRGHGPAGEPPLFYDDLERAFRELDELVATAHLQTIAELPESARIAVFAGLEAYRRITDRARGLERALRAVVIRPEMG